MREPPHRITSVVATIVLLAAVLILYVLGGLFSRFPMVIICQGAALFLSVWARTTFGLRSFHFAANPTAGALVTTGPYRFIRNPIYAAVWLFTWAGIAAHPSLTTAGLGLLILFALIARIFCEERLLHEQFSEYPAYARKTARLIPSIF